MQLSNINKFTLHFECDDIGIKRIMSYLYTVNTLNYRGPSTEEELQRKYVDLSIKRDLTPWKDPKGDLESITSHAINKDINIVLRYGKYLYLFRNGVCKKKAYVTKDNVNMKMTALLGYNDVE